MKFKSIRNLLVWAISVLLSSAIAGCSGSSTNTTTTVIQTNSGGSIQGVLLDASTREPIVGAVVDVGVAKATTSSTGQFAIPNLPVAIYHATIDLSGVFSPLNMASTTGLHYPKYVFQSLTAFNTTGAASSVPATASVSIPIGKLAATVSGVVTDASGAPVGLGYNVTLATATAPTSVVSTTQTTATGSFSFLNIQSQGAFSISAADTAGAFASANAVAVTAPIDGGTINKTVSVTPTNNLPPTVVSVTPQHNSDIAPVANQQVVFTFSKPIKQTAVVSSTSASNPAGLYSYVAVNFAGNKAIRASNIAHTLAWSADRTQLTVTLPVVGVSATYIVDLCNAPLTDDAGVAVSGLGTACLNLPPLAANAAAGIAGKGYVSFTTNGGATAAAPGAVNLTNAASLDAKKGALAAIVPTFDWLPVSGAKAYNIYRATKQVWGTGASAPANTHPAVKLNATPLLISSYTDATLVDYVENGSVKLAYDYTVASLNSDSIESAPSTVVTAEDKVAPKLTQVGSSATLSSITIAFDEVVDPATAANVVNYSVALTATPVPVLTPVSITENVNAANIVTGYTLNFAAGVTTANASTLTITGVKDIAGNAINVAADQVTFTAGAAGLPF